jgi:hypothetical protein
MTDKENIQNEVEKTLLSLDGIKRAEANPFLFTRIKARMQKERGWENVISFISKPAVAFAALIIIMAINGWTLFSPADNNTITDDESIAVADFDTEYNLASTTNYDYENTPDE